MPVKGEVDRRKIPCFNTAFVASRQESRYANMPVNGFTEASGNVRRVSDDHIESSNLHVRITNDLHHTSSFGQSPMSAGTRFLNRRDKLVNFLIP